MPYRVSQLSEECVAEFISEQVMLVYTGSPFFSSQTAASEATAGSSAAQRMVRRRRRAMVGVESYDVVALGDGL